MDGNIRAAIAKITVEGAEELVRGTAFLVARNVVATALHNVAEHDVEVPLEGDPAWLGQITLEFPDHTSTAKPFRWNYQADCVLLTCDNAPPPAIKPLALQELQRSGGDWEAYGFPNMQSLDGIVVDGRVTNHRAELYDTPAIQLFSTQLAAGVGGDARGLSGGPVLMHNAAIGLMRFALGPEDRTIGGTAYACPSRFFADLEPAISVQAMHQVQMLLDGERLQALVALYVSEFTGRRDMLETIVHYALGQEIGEITSNDPDRPFEQIVSELLSWANLQGNGPLEGLLYVTTRARPHYGELRAFCQAHASQALQPIDVGTLIFDIIQSLNALTGMMRASVHARTIRAIYREDFEVTLRQLRVVDQYKALHNILHDLQLTLEAIELPLGSPASDAAANTRLQRLARQIADHAEDAEQKIAGLNTEELERIWINGLKLLSQDMRAVAQPDATALDRGQVNISLRSLVTTASARINAALAEAAGDLRLASLVEMADAVIGQTAPSAQELAYLSQGAAAVGALAVAVAGVIAEHFAWQVVSTELEGAQNTLQHQPEKKIKDWLLFEKRLRALCGIYPEDPWSRRLTARLDDWVNATQNPNPTKEEKDAGKEALRTFSGSCKDRFYKVDESVKAMSDKIVQLSLPMTRLLNA